MRLKTLISILKTYDPELMVCTNAGDVGLTATIATYIGETEKRSRPQGPHIVGKPLNCETTTIKVLVIGRYERKNEGEGE